MARKYAILTRMHRYQTIEYPQGEVIAVFDLKKGEVAPATLEELTKKKPEIRKGFDAPRVLKCLLGGVAVLKDTPPAEPEEDEDDGKPPAGETKPPAGETKP